MLKEYPVDVIKDREHLNNVVVELINQYGNSITIHIIDPQSPLGFFKTLCYWVKGYPTFIVDGKVKIAGWDQKRRNVI